MSLRCSGERDIIVVQIQAGQQGERTCLGPVESAFRLMALWCAMSGDKRCSERLRRELEILRARVKQLERAQKEHRQTSTALREWQGSYGSLIENTKLGITLIDQDHTIRTTNETQGHLFKKPVSAFIGEKCFKEFEKRDEVCSHCPGVRAMATGQPAEVETEGVRDDGSRFSARLHAFPAFDPDGAVTGFVEVVEDITDLKRAEEALRRAHEELEDRVRERTAELARANEALQADIAERKRMEEERERLSAQLREAHKLEAVGRFGRGVAHDFNNLMATVLGLASNMRSNRRPDDPDYAKLTHIEDAAEAAAKMAHQLLDFAKRGKIHPQLLSFRDVVTSALALISPMAPQNVTVERHIESDLWRVNCDRTQMQQVIVNLCRNALEAMPKGGHLTIRAENRMVASPLDDAQPRLAEGDYVCLSVKDTGCGMDAETLNRIFDPFFTTKKRGHGLGLAATYGVTAAHGGAISVASAPGKGSTFRLWLPRARRPIKRPILQKH